MHGLRHLVAHTTSRMMLKAMACEVVSRPTPIQICEPVEEFHSWGRLAPPDKLPGMTTHRSMEVGELP
jgi:hypothetical protein